MYNISQLDNGLRIVTHSVNDRNSVALGFWVGVGGRYEEDHIKGAAHFLEHMVFKGSRKYSCEQIKEKVEGVGGNLNAFTSEEQTCYYAKIPAQHLDKTFDILADMSFFPQLNPKELNKEKTVILEEIKMYYDLTQYHVLELAEQLLWPNHPLGKSLPGTTESVTQMSKGSLKAFHQSYYGAGNV